MYFFWCIDGVRYCTEVRFASLLSGGFITAIVVNSPKRKLTKRTSVRWRVIRSNLLSLLKFSQLYFSSPRMNGSGKNGRKNSSNNGGSSGKNLSKNQHNHLNKPQSMDAFFFGNTSTVSNKFLFKWYFVTKIVLTYCEKKLF